MWEENQNIYSIDGGRKIIRKLKPEELSCYRVIGAGSGPFAYATYLGWKYCPNFLQRVVGFTVSGEGIGEMLASTDRVFLRHKVFY